MCWKSLIINSLIKRIKQFRLRNKINKRYWIKCWGWKKSLKNIFNHKTTFWNFFFKIRWTWRELKQVEKQRNKRISERWKKERRWRRLKRPGESR